MTNTLTFQSEILAMIYQVGTIVLQNLAVWFGRLLVYFWPSGFYLFGRPDSAVWARLLVNIKNNNFSITI